MEDNQFHIKKVVAEMGGKNVVIVDADADLDDVVPALLSSAFGFAGQKCSAASRVLVHAQIADALADRLAGAIRTLQVGPAEDFAIDVGPVIDADAQTRVRRYAGQGAAAATHVAAANGLPADGFYVAPTLLIGLPDEHPVIEDEIFGPVLALQSVVSIEEACDEGRRLALRAHRRALLALTAHGRARCRARRPSATCTSTARSRGRWSAASRSAAGACRAPARRPAAPTTCCSSSRRGRSPRTPSATAWWSERPVSRAG